jgi:hypothetical protein
MLHIDSLDKSGAHTLWSRIATVCAVPRTTHWGWALVHFDTRDLLSSLVFAQANCVLWGDLCSSLTNEGLRRGIAPPHGRCALPAQRRRPLGMELEAPSLTGVRHGSSSPPRYGLRPELYALAYGYWLPNTVSDDTHPTPSPTVPPSTAPVTKGTNEYPRYCRVADGGGRVLEVMQPVAGGALGSTVRHLDTARKDG